jgi:hypothetical protein
MKKLFFTFMLSAICGMASAQSLTIDDIAIQPGETASFTLVVNVGDLKVNGFQFEQLTLPEGLSLTKVTTTNPAFKGGQILVGTTKGSCFTTTDGSYIPQNKDFEIGTIELLAESGMTEKDYTVSFPANDFNFLDGTNYYPVTTEVSFTVTVKTFETVELSEDATSNPSAQDDVNVVVKRTIAANEWSTIFLPFAMNGNQVKKAFGEDVKLAEFSGWSFECPNPDDTPNIANNVKIVFTQFDADGGMKVGHPYMIKVSKPVTEFEVKSVSINPANEKVEQKCDMGDWDTYTLTMMGNYKVAKLPAKQFFVSENKMWYNNGTTQIKGFRASFKFDTNLDLAFLTTGSRITMVFGDEVTDNIIDVQTREQNNEYFNLGGQRVDTPAKGIYIKNGKKVVVK